MQLVSPVPYTLVNPWRTVVKAERVNDQARSTWANFVSPTDTSPHVSSGGEMITPRFEFTKDFAKEWNNPVYCRPSKMLCGFKDQVRGRPSGERCGLRPAPARDPGEKYGPA